MFHWLWIRLGVFSFQLEGQSAPLNLPDGDLTAQPKLHLKKNQKKVKQDDNT